jgi:hypothetical protein
MSDEAIMEKYEDLSLDNLLGGSIEIEKSQVALAKTGGRDLTQGKALHDNSFTIQEKFIQKV